MAKSKNKAKSQANKKKNKLDAKDDFFSADCDAPLKVSLASSLLKNDLSKKKFAIVEVNGDKIGAGKTITLESGAKLTIKKNGTFDYDANGCYSKLPVGETAYETFTYKVLNKKGGFDTATCKIKIEGKYEAPAKPQATTSQPDNDTHQQPDGPTNGSCPTVGDNDLVVLDDDKLPGGNPGGPNDNADPIKTTGTLLHNYGAGGVGSLVLLASGAPAGFTYAISNGGKTVIVKQTSTGKEVLKIELTDTTSGKYTVTELNPIMHPGGNGENDARFVVLYRVTDHNGKDATGALTIDVDDDSPTVCDTDLVVLDDDKQPDGNPGGPGDTIDPIKATGTLTHSYGADGDGSVLLLAQGAPSGFSYALSDGGKTLIVSQNGNGAVLKICLTDSTSGKYQVTQLKPIDHPGGNAENDVRFVVLYRVYDKDGDDATGALTIDVDDDSPIVCETTNVKVDEEGLRHGNYGDSYPWTHGDLPGDEVCATGTLGIKFGADGPKENGAIELRADCATWDEDCMTLTANDGSWKIVVDECGDYKFTLLKAMDHDQSKVEDDLCIVVNFTATDADCDSVCGSFTIKVDDDAPEICEPTCVYVDEEGLPRGNYGDSYPSGDLPGDDVCATGTLGVKFGADGPKENGAFELSADCATWDDDCMTLTANDGSWKIVVDECGDYKFTLLKAMDHDQSKVEDDLCIVVNFTATDADCDSVCGSFTIKVDDDAPVVCDQFAGKLDDEAQAFGIAGDPAVGDLPGANLKVLTGTLDFSAGADGLKEISFAEHVSAKNTVNGVVNPLMVVVVDPVTKAATQETISYHWTQDGAGGTLIGTSASYPDATNPVFKLTVEADGDYKLEMFAPLAHPLTDNPGTLATETEFEDELLLNLDFTVTDKDCDPVCATFTVKVDDDTPDVDFAGATTVADNAQPVTGTYVFASGADGVKTGALSGLTVTVTGEQPIFVTAANLANGETIVTAAGTLKLDPPNGSGIGNWTFTPNDVTAAKTVNIAISLTDGDGDLQSDTHTIIVNNANTLPTGGTTLAYLDDDGLSGNLIEDGTDDDVVPNNDGDNNEATWGGTLTHNYNGELPGDLKLVAGSESVGGNTFTYAVSPDGHTLTASIASTDYFKVEILNTATGEYKVTLLAPIPHAGTSPGVEDNLTFTVAYQVKDASGDVAPGTLKIDIDDDTPDAVADGPVAVTEGDPASIGNVLTNDDLGADHGVVGADAHVSNIASNNVPLNTSAIAASGSATIAGAFGSLTLEADGDYSYTPNASVPNGSVDTFTYTVVDQDGDTDTATLTFSYSDDVNSPTATNGAATTSDVPGDDGVVGSNADGFVSQVSNGSLAFSFGIDGPHATTPFAAVYDGNLGALVSQTSVANVTTITTASWTLTINELTGVYSFTQTAPYQHDSGAATDSGLVTVTLTDSDGSSLPVTLTLTINDDVPDAVADGPVAVTEGDPASIGNVLTNDDLGADHGVVGADAHVSNIASNNVPLNTSAIAASGSATIAGAFGSLTLEADGDYSYTPNASVPNGSVDTFTYTVVDQDGDTDTATLTFSYSDDVNSPTATNGAATTSDVPGDDGVVGSNADGFVSQVSNGSLAFSFGIDGPHATTPFAAVYDGNLGALVSQTSVANVTTITTASWTLTINELTGVYSFTQTAPYQHDSGAATDSGLVTVTLTDSDGSSLPVTLTLTINDDVPDAVADGPVAVTEGDPASIGNVLTNDDLGADHGVVGADAHVSNIASNNVPLNTSAIAASGSATIAGAFGSLTLEADGDYSYTPNASVPNGSVDTFTYTVVDQDGDTDTATLTFSYSDDVNSPTATNGAATTSDVPGDDGVVGSNADGFVSQVSNGSLAFSFGIDGPHATTPFAAVYDGNLGALVSQTSVANVTTITTASWTLTINELTGVYSFTQTAPYQHDSGAATDSGLVTVTLTDSDGSSLPVTLTLTINDDVPDAVADGPVAVTEGDPASIGNVLTNDDLGADHGVVGADAHVSNIASNNVPLNTSAIAASGSATIAGAFGSLTLEADGDYSYTPNASVPNGSVDTFTYTVVDQDGDTDTATLTFSYSDDVNSPTATNGAATTSDVPGDDGVVGSNADGFVSQVSNGSLAFSFGIDGPHATTPFAAVYDGNLGALVSQTSVANVTTITTASWTLTINELTGVYSFTQTAPYQHDSGAATDSGLVTVTLTDSDGSSLPVTLTLTINDDVPDAVADGPVAVTEGDPASIGNVLTNDDLGADHGVVGADAHVSNIASNNVPLNTSAIAASGSATIAGAFGSLTLEADGDYSYTPNASVPNGSVDTFTYTVVDQDGDTDTATLTFSYSDDVNSPTATNGAATTSDVPGDDGVVGSNADGFVSQVSNGSLAFSFGIDGPHATTPFAAVYDGNLGALVSQTSVANVTTITTASWTLTINELTGVYSFTQTAPYQHDSGAATDSGLVTVTLTDSDGSSLPVTLTLTINDDVPDAVADGPVAVTEGDPASIGNVLTNDDLGADHGVVGADAHVSNIASNNVPLNTSAIAASGSATIAGAFGSLTLEADGDYSYTPNASVPNGSVDTFTYTVVDQDGDTDTATLTFSYSGDPNLPSGGTTLAAVDDDGLGGNSASLVDDLDANVGDADGPASSEATFSGTLTFGFGGDGAGSIDFASMHGAGGTVGTEAVTYSWSGGSNTLTATGPRGPLFKVLVNPTTGAYTVELLDNVLQASGPNQENAVDPTTSLTYTIKDADNSTTTGTLTVTFDDDAPTASIALNGATAVVADETSGDDAGSNDILGIPNTPVPAAFSGIVGTAIEVAQNATALVVSTGSAYGADGAGTTVFGLAVSSTGVDSGLDTTDGRNIFLYKEGSIVVGRASTSPGGVANPSGAVAFAVSLDSATGVTAVAQYLSIKHDDRGDPDESNDDGTVGNDAAPTEGSPPVQQMITNGALLATVTVTDGDGDTATQQVAIGSRIKFEDDGPTANTLSKGLVESGVDTNLMLILDVSGSMAFASGLTGITRLELLKAAAVEVLEQYASQGSVSVRVVTFSDNAAEHTATWESVADAKSFILGLTASGGTDYDDATVAAANAWADAGKLATSGVRNVSYFLSDGDPDPNSDGLDDGEETTWTTFLNNNDVNSLAIGMGTGISDTSQLDRVAFDGRGTGTNTNGQIIVDPAQLTPTLVTTAQTATGNLVTDGGNTFGADGGFVLSVTADSTTYTYNPASGGSVSFSGGPNNGVFNTTPNSLTVTTVLGGTFVVDLDDGSYTYTPPNSVTTSFSETIGYALQDNDGDTASSNLNISVAVADLPPIVRDDRVITNFNGTTSGAQIDIPHYALLFNDSDANGQAISITAAVTSSDLTSAAFDTPAGFVRATDNNSNGGQFTYTGSTTSPAGSDTGLVGITRTASTTLTGTGLGDILLGGTTNDTINGNEGDDVAIGNGGTDTINGGTGKDWLVGGAGNDTLIGAQDDFQLDGGADTDTLQIGANFTSTSDGQIVNVENVTLTAAATLDLSNQTEVFTITGSGGADTITSGSGADSISAGNGNDIIDGAQNDTLLEGGGNTDTLQLGANFTSTSNAQIANIENVILTAAATLNLSNQIEGFTIIGSGGIDSITGGAGNDIIVGAMNDTLFDGGAGTGDVLNVGANFTSTGNAQIANIEKVTLTAAATLNLTNQMEGLVITGSSGVDTITGGSGADIITAGAGNDSVTGGLGADQFRMQTDSGTDTITDYTDGTDKIAFGGVNFGNTTETAAGAALSASDLTTRASISAIESANDDNQVIVITAAQTTAQITTDNGSGMSTPTNLYVIVFNSTTGRGEIWFDNNWEDTGSRVKIATLDNITTLGGVTNITAADIVAYNAAVDPIILDLDPDGISFTDVDGGVQFDINADGALDQMAWTASADGILTLDLDGSGAIENGSEVLSEFFAGGGHADGLAALASLDDNEDGVIDSADAAFAELLVWQDLDHDGVSDAGELKSLSEHGIACISLAVTPGDGEIDGQIVVANGVFTYADGSSGSFVEVDFDATLGTASSEDDSPLVGEDGVADVFRFETVDAVSQVENYNGSEGDTLDLAALLDAAFAEGGAAGDFVQVAADGDDIQVFVDLDGTGEGLPAHVASLLGANTAGDDPVKVAFGGVTHNFTV